MLQLALGVVDAVPVDRRADLAEERLLSLASEHRFNRRSTHQDVLWEAAAEVILNLERLYYEGRLDMTLCGMPPQSPDADPVVLIDKIASQIAIDIGRNNYTLLASTCIEALATWAQANPILDVDDAAPTKLRWERGTDRHSFGDST
ncbi:MAG: hypothetical protein QOE09_2586 [Ilumatobacteraceae bacterium]|jgi:hypothetical protein